MVGFVQWMGQKMSCEGFGQLMNNHDDNAAYKIDSQIYDKIHSKSPKQYTITCSCYFTSCALKYQVKEGIIIHDSATVTLKNEKRANGPFKSLLITLIQLSRLL